MAQPTWNEIAGNTLASLNQARGGLSDARDWMNSDWREGHEPVDHKQRHEAARLIAQAKSLIDQAKNAVRQSAGG